VAEPYLPALTIVSAGYGPAASLVYYLQAKRTSRPNSAHKKTG